MSPTTRAGTSSCASAATGPYLERTSRGRRGESQRANLPDDLPPTSLPSSRPRSCSRRRRRVARSAPTRDRATRSWRRRAASGPTSPRSCPRAARRSRAPARCFKSMTLGDDARRRAEAADAAARGRRGPESGEEITAQNGRYGPYLKKGTDSRSLDTEDQLFTVTLDEALKIFAQPSSGRAAANRRSRSRPDPAIGQPWWSRTAGSGRTSPTARPTPACARATRWSPSPTSVPPNAREAGQGEGSSPGAGRAPGEEGPGEQGPASHGQDDRPRRRPRRRPPRNPPTKRHAKRPREKSGRGPPDNLAVAETGRCPYCRPTVGGFPAGCRRPTLTTAQASASSTRRIRSVLAIRPFRRPWAVTRGRLRRLALAARPHRPGHTAHQRLSGAELRARRRGGHQAAARHSLAPLGGALADKFDA